MSPLPASLRGLGGQVADRMKSGFVWSVVAAGFTHGSTFLSGILLANLLGRDDFGRFSLLRNAVLTVAALAPFATGITGMKYTAELRKTDKVRAGRVLGLCLLVSVTAGAGASALFSAAGPPLARSYLRAPEVATLFVIAGAGILFQVLSSYSTSVLAGAEAYRSFAYSSGVAGLMALAVIVAGGWRYGLVGSVGGLVGATIIQAAVFGAASHVTLRKEGIGVHLRGVSSEMALVKHFIVPAALGGLAAMPAQWLAASFLARQTNGFGELAIFSAAFSLRNLVLALPGLGSVVGASILNHEYGAGSPSSLGMAVRTLILTTGSLAFLGGGAVILAGRPLLSLFGKTFETGYSVLTLLALSAILEALVMALNHIFVAEGRLWRLFSAVLLPRDVTLVVAAVFLTATTGAVGLALSHLVAHGLALGLAIWNVRTGGVWRRAWDS